MKKYLLLFATLILSVSACAQVRTLAGSNFTSGGYGGPVIKVGRFNGITGFLSGGRGAWIINHKLAIGGGSYSSMNDMKSGMTGDNGRQLYAQLNYGGFEIEYIHNDSRQVHWTIQTTIGGGAIKLLEHNPGITVEKDNIFMIEPSLNAEVNILRWFRIGCGMSYRVSMGLNLYTITNYDISGLSGQIIFKFGSF